MRLGIMAATAALVACAPANAVGIVYTVTGVFDVTIDAVTYDDASLTFTGVAETDEFIRIQRIVSAVTLRSLSFDLNGTTYSYTDPVQYFVNRAENFSGFTDPQATRTLLSFYATDGSFSSYFGGSTKQETPLQRFTGFGYSAFSTTGGPVLITDGTGLTFSAVAEARAVPEPATWAMLVGGIGLAGGALRARRRVARLA